MTSPTVLRYRWTPEGFLRAHEAGAFDSRVELVDGEVWPVVIDDWHGDAVAQAIGLLGNVRGAKVTSSSLATGESIPDPDLWVRRDDAVPVAGVSERVSRWDPADVLLVVEVSDETLTADLTTKAHLYGSAGYPVYWVVSADVVYEHTEPTPDSYRLRAELRRGDRIAVPYADLDLSVDEILG